MKLFNKPKAQPSHHHAMPDIQASPYVLATMPGKPILIVDSVFSIGTNLWLAGWRTDHHTEVGLYSKGTKLDTDPIYVDRPDVAQTYKLADPGGKGLGFVLHVTDYNTDDISLACWKPGHQPVTFAPLRIGTLEEISNWYPFGGICLLLRKLTPFTPVWQQLLSRAPILTKEACHAKAFLEIAVSTSFTNAAVVAGWEVHDSNSLVWIEDDHGRAYSLDNAFRRYRQDVVESGISNAISSHNGYKAGFVIHLHDAGNVNCFSIKALSEEGVQLLHQINVTRLPEDPVIIAQLLFGIYSTISEFHERVPLVDEPMLRPLIKHRVATWEHLPVHVKQLGALQDNILVSVIVPLYGRSDFVEHQLIELCEDSWFSRHAELIYVLDDPALVDDFSVRAEELYRLYRLPFRWVWGGINRGFSGANNLGAESARGEYLLFMNSDVIPQQAGWLEQLVAVLQQNPSIGVVGPRLVYADGGIQHAGMAFMRVDEFGVWVNYHPWQGIDPALDPHREITIVPAVTGACMLMRYKEFEQIGGWDVEYLIGDFEDSDLCLAMRAQGLQIAYLPSVQLVHLERQSFKLFGAGEFRQRVTLFNAVRQQGRWGTLIEASQYDQ